MDADVQGILLVSAVVSVVVLYVVIKAAVIAALTDERVTRSLVKVLRAAHMSLEMDGTSESDTQS